MSPSITNDGKKIGSPRTLTRHVAATSAAALLATAACGEATTVGTATIEPAVGTNVVLNVLSQTNILVSIAGPDQAVASVSVPRSLGAAGSAGGIGGTVGAGGADVSLPVTVTALGGGGLGMPNGVAMSVGGMDAGAGETGSNTMLVVVQYN